MTPLLHGDEVTLWALARRRRANRLRLALYAAVLLAVVAVLVWGPWPLAFVALPLGGLLLFAGEVAYERARRATFAAHAEARAKM